MYEFFTQNSLYVVLSVVMTVWIGIAVYLVRLERTVAKLQSSTDSSSGKQ
jgi:CcmD family protein